MSAGSDNPRLNYCVLKFTWQAVNDEPVGTTNARRRIMRKGLLLQVFSGILMVLVYLAPQANAAKLSASDHSEFQRIITAVVCSFNV